MAISTKLFTERQLDNFSNISSKIEQNQAKVSTGKAVAKPSDDPETVLKASALDEKILQTASYIANLNTADDRLSFADAVLEGAATVLTRLGELAIQAANDTYSVNDKALIKAEVAQLRSELLSLANAKDSRGKPLFSGSTGMQDPFKENFDGSVEYHGNNQRSHVRSTSNTTIADSISGAEVFFAEVPWGERVSYFDIIDNLILALESPTDYQTSAQLRDPESKIFKIQSSDEVNAFSFDLSGSFGVVSVQFTTTNNSVSDAIASINEHTALTGITAEKSGEGFVLRNATDDIEIKNFSDGTDFGLDHNQIIILGSEGEQDKLTSGLRRVNRNIELINSAQENIGLKRATVGSLLNRVESSLKINQNMQDMLEISYSEIASADLEKLITELQSLLVNRDVSRQTYTNITRTTLFDFIR